MLDQPRQLGPQTDTSARQANELQLYLGEHIGVVGSTGTGKTVFVTRGLLPYLKQMYPHVPRYVIDSTGDPDMLDLIDDPLPVEGNVPPDVLHDSRSTIVWTPRNSKIPLQYADFFNKLIDARKPGIIVIDEIASITKQALLELETLFKQMRKHGGTVIGETQRIAKVDSDMFSQLTHFFLFNINPEPYDLQQARSYLRVPKEEFELPHSKYGFHYRRTRGDWPSQEYVDYHDFFDKNLYPKGRRYKWGE